MSGPLGRSFGMSNTNTQFTDVFMGSSSLHGSGQTISRRRRLEMPSNPFEDEEETNDMAKVLKELSEIKDMVKGVQAKQRDIEKNVQRLTRAMDKKEFDLAKSAHAANVTKILAKAYIQLGRFSKSNDSKTEQLQNEFCNSTYGLSMPELLEHAASFEKAKFTYWRAEERRRILAIGSWSTLRDAPTSQVAAKICGLLGVKFNAQLETSVRQQTALVKEYIDQTGYRQCQADDKFWLNFYKWSEEKYGPRGPTAADYEIIMAEE